MVRTKKNKLLSIKVINYFLFLLVIYNSLLFFIFEKYFNQYSFYFFIINLILLIIFYYINKLFEQDYQKSKSYMKTLNSISLIFNDIKDDKKINTALKWEFQFKENKDFYNNFRLNVIKNNLLKKDYQDLKNILLKFTPKPFLEEIWEKWTETINLWMSLKKQLHIMFLDIIWFTKISEKMLPEKALKLLNIYFDWIVEIVKKNWWYVDKFLWDWMLIIFSWNESDKVVKTAVEIEQYINSINFYWNNKKISIWIWINSWNVIIWTIWSKNRMEITVIWDVVNTAAKLEELTRRSKYQILITDNCYKKIRDKSKFKIEDFWFKNIKWKKERIKIYWVEY